MRRAATILPFLALAGAASAQTQPADERFFMGLFLPLMIGLGIVIVVLVVIANVVAARRRANRMAAFDPTLGPGPSPFGSPSFGAIPDAPPRTVSKTTTTTSADGSVTVTVIEESVGTTRFGGNGVVDPELLGGGLNGGALEQEILNEVRDAFRRIENPRKPS